MARYLIWPDLYKEHGHWLPCVSLANSLMVDDATNVVEFMGIPDCRSIVSPYGATFHEVLGTTYPAGHSVENKLEPLDQRWKPAHLMPLCRGEEGLEARFTAGNRPDVLICGYFSALEALLLHHKYQVRIVIMTTYLRHPMDDPAIFAKTKLVYMPRAYVRAMLDAVSPTKQLTIEEFIHPIEGFFPELIPCPKELDFTDEDWIHGSNVVYVEPMITRSALGTIPSDAPKPPDLLNITKPVIFATSGSQVQDYEAKAREFFRNLILMMQAEGMDSYFLLASVGAKLKKELDATFSGGDNKLPSNVLLVEWASQLEILHNPGTVAVFMHGGLATVKEAIWQEKPIIVVPHGKDQLDNALRLKRLNLAMVAQQGDLDPLNLRKLLMSALSNSWMQKSIAKMQDVFATYENPSAGTRKLSLQELTKVLSNPAVEPPTSL